MITIEEIRVAEAEAMAESLLKKLKELKPEQLEIQADKKKYSELKSNKDSKPDEVKRTRHGINVHIYDYNRRRQVAENRCNEANQIVEELRKTVESFKNKLEEKETSSFESVSEFEAHPPDSVPPDSQSPDLVSSPESVPSKSYDKAAMDNDIF